MFYQTTELRGFCYYYCKLLCYLVSRPLQLLEAMAQAHGMPKDTKKHQTLGKSQQLSVVT